jgi:alkanesulfonate monooxygenase SsuD/methylene tetrahydromethanopterin reductase-like flavin-dependent oxidoreductase (luciferase family)
VTKYGEAVEIVARLVHDGALTFEGQHYRVDGAVIEPRGPRAGGMTVFAAGLGDRTAQIAARHADQINVNRAIASEADALEVVAIARRACEAVGRNPSTLGVTGWARLAIDDDGVAIDRPGCLAGEPAEVATTVRAVRAAGVQHLTMYIGTADDPSPLPALTDETLDRFAPYLDAIRAA